MPVNRQWVRNFLQQFDFESLFIEELGWDTVDLNIIPVGTDDEPYQAQAIAQKRGMVVYHCQPENGGSIPSNSTRRKIDHQINQYTREHLIIYSDEAQQNQIWQWVRREKGKPLAAREYQYHINQDGESLVQKLEALVIDLDEEEALTLTEVTKRTRKAFDLDKVTKRFYDRFKKEHGRFLDFINGIQEQFDQEWYCSIMLNRLMFVYFMQKKGFLDGDSDYLRNRLNTCQQDQGNDEFYSFYRYFLLRLFHEGLGSPDRDDPTLDPLIGKIPYLNGGLFDVHELEERYPEIQVPDEAFEKVFDFFDDYQWHLDDRPLQNDKEINPDVLGYIFEKYINQKQMGAYYTKEDITDYIGKNTIIPYLLDAAKKECAIAFEPDGDVWKLLQDNPNRYIYDAVQKGVDLDLPEEITAGIDDISKRDTWNRLADDEYALPTELWREYVARRQRCLEVREKLRNGEIYSINDLITYNLDIRQFAQDIVEQCEDPTLLQAIWYTLAGRQKEVGSNHNERYGITILDPTCGSGAFLFAALNILEPLYSACLSRMEGFVNDSKQTDKPSNNGRIKEFEKILKRVSSHPNHTYFILKSIILENLYGVDIMEEAVEICKLRLFLRLASVVDADNTKKNYGIEPLPDIDFNIRAGNTLVGFSSLEEARQAITQDKVAEKNETSDEISQFKFDFDDELTNINELAEIADKQFQMFRWQQTQADMSSDSFKEAKKKVRDSLTKLNNELNQYLATEYTVPVDDSEEFEVWLNNHRPFHWFVEFYRIINDGGFDVVIGNPPYIESHKIKEYTILNYVTRTCGNIYAPCLERGANLLRADGFFSMILPLSGFSTLRMSEYQNYVYDRFPSLHISFYSGDAHPSILFSGVKYRLCILIGKTSNKKAVYSSDYLRWYANERRFLFSSKVFYKENSCKKGFLRFGKLGTPNSSQIIEKIMKTNKPIKEYFAKSGDAKINYHRSPVFWIRSMDFEPFFSSATKQRSTDHLKDLFFESIPISKSIGAALNSTLFYFWFSIQGNCRNIAGLDIESFPLGEFEEKMMFNLTNALGVSRYCGTLYR